MDRVVVDARWQALLRQLNGLVAIYDESDRILGWSSSVEETVDQLPVRPFKDRVRIDKALQAVIRDIRLYTGLCDEAGARLGYFVPKVDVATFQLQAGTTHEVRGELQKCYTTAEVLTYVHNL